MLPHWSMVTANKALAHLEKLGIVQRLHEGKRNRLFVYGEYMRILEGDVPALHLHTRGV